MDIQVQNQVAEIRFKPETESKNRLRSLHARLTT
jgi:hypothetical protein